MSSAENLALMIIESLGYPEPVRQARLVPGRKFQADFSWARRRLVLEVEGGIYKGGRHVSPQGFLGDIEKYNLFTALGWRVFRVAAHRVAIDLPEILEMMFNDEWDTK
jgi:very-short-patch-repair endonuclease